jgi:hypothetical protein
MGGGEILVVTRESAGAGFRVSWKSFVRFSVYDVPLLRVSLLSFASLSLSGSV